MRGDDDSVDDMMPWWLGDYWRDTGDLDCREHGAYLQLLGRLWSAKGYLPFDPERLAKIVNLRLDEWAGVWSTISRFFTVADGRLSQRRGLLERERAIELKLQKHEAGLAGATARWAKKHPTSRKGKRGLTDGVALRSQCPPSPSGTKRGEKRGPREDARPVSPTLDKDSQESEPGPRPPHSPADLFGKLLGSFNSAWKSRYGVEYISTPKDRAQFGRFLQPLTPGDAAALPDLFLAYLRDEDPFVADKQRHSLAFFCTSGGLNKYRTKPPAQPRHRNGSQKREDDNAAATAAWLARNGAGNGRG